jgi:hypothetical protein
MMITYKITETGSDTSRLVYETTDIDDARRQVQDTKWVIRYEGVQGMTIPEFNALSDSIEWKIHEKPLSTV